LESVLQLGERERPIILTAGGQPYIKKGGHPKRKNASLLKDIIYSREPGNIALSFGVTDIEEGG
jgi:hypothetical protein